MMMFFTPVIDDVYLTHQYVRTALVTYQNDHADTYTYIPIVIDQQRMDKALNADRVALPKGLDKAQIHDFLLNRAKQLA